MHLATDPVLASDVKSETGTHPDRLGFSLAAEGGLNDGAAFPFVMLGLGLLGLHDLGPGAVGWWTIDFLWATLGGLLIGAALGAASGRLVVYLRSRHGEAVGLDEFLGLGLVALAYGIAQLSLASGFLAVFAAGLALQRVREHPRRHTRPLAAAAAGSAAGHPYDKLATHSHHASVTMRDSVQGFNAQLERLAELTVVLVVGAMLAYAKPLPAALWFVPLMLLLLRPLSVVVALTGERVSLPQQAMVGWFGIRGIGSVFYLLFVLRYGIAGPIADTLISLTLWTVAASIVAHGVTVQPLMQRYIARRRRRPASKAPARRRRTMIEPLLLTTARLCTFDGQRLLTGASGFFFERDERLFLVTSRHVLIDEPSEHLPDRIEIELHTDAHNLTQSTALSMLLYRDGKSVWRQGSDAGGEIDVAVIEIDRAALPDSVLLRCLHAGPPAGLAAGGGGRHLAADRRLPARLPRHAAPPAGGAPGGDRLVLRPALPGPGLLPHRCAHAPRHQRRAGGDARPRRRSRNCPGSCWACTRRAWTWAPATGSRTNRWA